MGVVAFRADASLDIGTGHIMRCLTLANALHANGERCLFICRQHPGNLIELITDAGFETLILPVAAAGKSHKDWLRVNWRADVELSGNALQGLVVDWLVVDHYALDANWESAMRPRCKQLMVIDDLADRLHDCDLLLDQNLGHTVEDYAGLVPKACCLLVGTEYTMLRPEFSQMREYSLKRRANPSLDHILITMGGVDQNNATGQVLEALEASVLPENSRVTVIMGPHAPWLKEIKRIVVAMPWEVDVKVGVNNMAKLMADSDLAIGAAGSTAWERCCLGLPSLILVLAENQKVIAEALHDRTAAIKMCDISKLSTSIPTGADLAQIGQRASILVDGQGVKRVRAAMECIG
ncbi:UDP-2,4-diacetamido-2,4,6-trideoxy-beta-L-altropyranose hydrolase [Ascidiaceihabitans sp.]|nr:UDP-2,4-diacetamido-2,4,6-trideoxy-beta-L-altropyranose hydrolase [Ascidiaceihabitans sp.]